MTCCCSPLGPGPGGDTPGVLAPVGFPFGYSFSPFPVLPNSTIGPTPPPAPSSTVSPAALGPFAATNGGPGFSYMQAFDPGYRPADSADWPPTIGSPSACSTTSQALNVLGEDRVHNSANAAGLGPANSITYTTGAVSPLKSGVYCIWGVASCDTGAATGPFTCSLLVDGAVVAVSRSGATNNVGSPFSVQIKTTVTKNATHTFGLRVTAAANNITANAGDFNIMAMEI